MDFNDELNECSDFPSIFGLVKQAVEITLNRRRVGLMLGLADLPPFIGAFHAVGSNFIVMNKTLLKEITQTYENKKLTNAYIFHILLHEYIHSLGFLDERLTRDLTYAISERVFGEDHVATQMARYGIARVFPDIKLEYSDPRAEMPASIEIINDFERDNLSYIG
jgi:hypothetical protein